MKERKQRTAGIMMWNIKTGEEMVVRNLQEVTKITGISGTQSKKLIETGNMSIKGWVLDIVEART